MRTAPQPWTPEEIAILAEQWKTNRPVSEWQHLLPNRTYKAIKAYGERHDMGNRANGEWSDEEKQILRAHWKSAKVSTEVFQMLPNRSEEAIRRMAHRMRLESRRKVPGAATWETMQQILADGRPRTVAELEEESGWSERNIRTVIRDHIGQDLFISRWIPRSKTGAPPTAVFALGKRRNAPKPKALSRAQTQKRYWKRAKEEQPEKIAAKIARDKLVRVESAGKLHRPDPAASWMFNPC